MLQVNVELKERRYPITIGAGLLGDPNKLFFAESGDKVMIVSNPTVAAHYLAT
ncbi:3-dehydroquinate synthase [Actinobacillus pleuropneumoniae]|nr:3-dehydroquinate synthase [Actinobacillus pleuropneumoniae]